MLLKVIKAELAGICEKGPVKFRFLF